MLFCFVDFSCLRACFSLFRNKPSGLCTLACILSGNFPLNPSCLALGIKRRNAPLMAQWKLLRSTSFLSPSHSLSLLLVFIFIFHSWLSSPWSYPLLRSDTIFFYIFALMLLTGDFYFVLKLTSTTFSGKLSDTLCMQPVLSASMGAIDMWDAGSKCQYIYWCGLFFINVQLRQTCTCQGHS